MQMYLKLQESNTIAPAENTNNLEKAQAMRQRTTRVQPLLEVQQEKLKNVFRPIKS